MSHALAEVAPPPLPEAWDRKTDMVMAFAADMDMRWRVANILAKSGMVRESRPEAVMAISLKAFEMGVPLMQAMSGMFFVDGKVALEGHLLDALAIQRCGVRKTIHESTRRVCRLTLHRDSWDSCEVSFTLDDAKAAGLIKDFDATTGEVTPAVSNSGKAKLQWKKHTEEMLYWRALSKGLKRIAPDYFGGTYTVDELEPQVDVVSRGRIGTNDELDALDEPDPDILSEDEIEKMSKEVREAERTKLILPRRAQEIVTAATEGRWADARAGWDEVRSVVLNAQPAVS